jgi:hydrogenase maturation factor
MRGVKRAVLYGLTPHNLGYCGPKCNSAAIFFEYLSGKVGEVKIKKILKSFRAAYPYYQLIAVSNKIKDPFDDRVVEAYWLGNKLLDNVKHSDIQRMIKTKFSAPGLLSKEEAKRRADNIPVGALPHHSIHVFIIGAVSGTIDLKGKLLDECRVAWGKVKSIGKINSEKQVEVVIEYQSVLTKKKLALGKVTKKKVFWDKRMIQKLKVGDWVSVHWGQVIERLGERQMKNLEKYTMQNIKITKARMRD